jgi:hypothetical protein
MFKKAVGVTLALLICGFAVPARAATPSKTIEDLTSVTQVTLQDGTSGSALMWVREEPSQLTVTQLEASSEYAATSPAISDYFPEDARNEAMELLPERTDLAQLIMSELISLGIGEYLEKYGNVAGTFLFPTEYEETQIVLAMVGYLGEDGTVLWQPLEAEVVGGELKIIFPEELMLKIGHDAVLAILST